MTKEQQPFNEKEWRKTWKRVGLELDDEQLSQVPNPQVEKELEEAKKPRRKLGSFWEDRY